MRSYQRQLLATQDAEEDAEELEGVLELELEAAAVAVAVAQLPRHEPIEQS